MEQDILNKIEAQDKKLDDIYQSVERMRKYFMWTLIVTLITVVLPLVGLVFAVPVFLQTLNFSGLGL